jgi:hypothetical protein
MTITAGATPAPDRGPASPHEPTSASPPFRFYDNRQKYLAFVNTCNEKTVISRRAAKVIQELRPTPPALRIFDAGMGDASVLSRLMASIHQLFPNVPLLAVAKEISLEDVRLSLEKMPDRFYEHPHTVLAITNLTYAEAPSLRLQNAGTTVINWHALKLEGESTAGWRDQIEQLAPWLLTSWQTRPNPKSGNPMVVRPSVLVIYREDHEFLLDAVIPQSDRSPDGYDFILASQPWRARMSAKFKVQKVLAPLARSLRPGGRLLTIQSYGHDPALEIVQRLWPGENPFVVGRRDLIAALRTELGPEADNFILEDPPDSKAVFQYQMHTLPSEIGDRIGTSTLFAAWNAAIYVNQIEDERLESVVTTGKYLDVTQAVLQKHGGLWFQDEEFIVVRKS